MEYACKHEMAVTVKDMLSLRMRLAYINSEAAKKAIPRVAELMAQHLSWSKKEKSRQIKLAEESLGLTLTLTLTPTLTLTLTPILTPTLTLTLILTNTKN